MPKDLQDLPINHVLKLLARDAMLRESDVASTDPTLRAALETCCRDGWVYEALVDPTSPYETIHYVFPSPLHAWHARRLLIPQTPNLVGTNFASPLALCLAVIRLFNSPRHRASRARRARANTAWSSTTLFTNLPTVMSYRPLSLSQQRREVA